MRNFLTLLSVILITCIILVAQGPLINTTANCPSISSACIVSSLSTNSVSPDLGSQFGDQTGIRFSYAKTGSAFDILPSAASGTKIRLTSYGGVGDLIIADGSSNAIQTIVTATKAVTFASSIAATSVKSSTLQDTNGNVFLASSATASAVDSVTITNAATATVPIVAIASSGTDTNVTVQVSGKGTGLVTHGSIIDTPNNLVRLDNAFTDANASGLQNITGLSWTLPANIAVIWPFHCRLVVNQNTAAVVDTIGIQDVTIAPTYIQATGVAETALTVSAYGDLGVGLTTTTATGIISFTPGAIGTNLTVLIDGIINQPSNASSSVIQMMVQQATAADTIIFQKGSFCSFGGTS